VPMHESMDDTGATRNTVNESASVAA
jgi:hypothetical protein